MITNKLKMLLLLCICMMSAVTLQAQTVRKGVVHDADSGEPLIGVTVLVKGTTRGATTDYMGGFSMSAKDSDTFIISYIGYETKEIVIGKSTDFGVINLGQDVAKLEEVVIVGYGVQQKASSVGSITQAKGEDLAKVGSVTTVSEALQGQMPGVVAISTTSKPGGDAADLFIRGKSTWGNASPLVLIDGIERDFNDVDVNEIESISVLKDASATAVYGVKGANGVILLTTKRGSKDKTEISFNANFGFKVPSSSPEWADYPDAIKAYNQGQINDGNWGSVVPESTLAAWENAYATGNYGPYNDVFPQVNWWDESVKDFGFQQSYNASATGGTDKMKYFVSLGYLNDGDIYKTVANEDFDPSFSFERYNWRSNFDFKITKTTDLAVNIAGKMSSQNQPGFRTDDDGNTADKWFFKWFFETPSNDFPIRYSDGYWGDGVAEGQNISVFLNDTGSRTKKYYQGFYDVKLKQDLGFLVKGLSAHAAVSYTTSSAWQSQLLKGKVLDTNSELNALLTSIRYHRTYDFANPTVNADGTISYPLIDEKRHPNSTAVGDLPVGGYYDNFKSYGRKLYYEAAIHYNRKFGKHNVTALALFNRKVNESTSGAIMDFPAYEEDWVGRVTYNYDQRYLFEVNGAYTGSERFAPGLRFGFFPSFSLGWRASEEEWIKSWAEETLTNLKFRFSYGVVGNDKGASRFNYIQVYDPTAKIQLGLDQNLAYGPTYKEGKLADPDATWETATKRNLGVDIGLFSKLNVTVDFFDEHRTGILMARQTLPSWFDSGVALPSVNLGEVKNHGFEVEAKWNDKIGKFNYFANFNFATSESRIVFKDDPRNQFDYLKSAGKPIGSNDKFLATGNYDSLDDIYNSPTTALGKGHSALIPGDLNYMDFNSDGVINDQDKAPTDELTYPLTTLGLNVGGNYKGFGFNMLWYSALDVYKEQISYYLWDFPASTIKAQPNSQPAAWTPETPIVAGEIVKPSLHLVNGHNSVNSTYSYTDHSYLRLKTVEVNYSLPKKFVQKIGLSRAQIYVNGNNLWTLSPCDDRRDPETSGANVYPIMKRYNIGCRIGF